MGKLTKLLAKAEQLAGKELEKLLTSQGGNGQQQQQQAYMPPTVVNSGVQHAQPAGFSTPPPSPPPYQSGLAMGVQPGAYRPGTPPMQVAQQQQQQQQVRAQAAHLRACMPGAMRLQECADTACWNARRRMRHRACSHSSTWRRRRSARARQGVGARKRC